MWGLIQQITMVYESNLVYRVLKAFNSPRLQICLRVVHSGADQNNTAKALKIILKFEPQLTM